MSFCHYITMHYADEVGVLNSSTFWPKNGPILLDKIVCSGEEVALLECEYDTVHRCVHDNDVAIICHRKLILIHLGVAVKLILVQLLVNVK